MDQRITQILAQNPAWNGVEITVTRLTINRFQIVTGTAFGTHDLAWMQRHMPNDGSIYMNDITSSRGCIGVWGPYARALLQQVSENDFSNAAFPYLTTQQVIIGNIPVLALRVTYVGELGWEIYAPTE